jgi:hypothetical protein
MLRGDGKVDAAQKPFGVTVIEAVVNIGHRHGEQRRRSAGVEPQQVPQPKRGAAQRDTAALSGGVRGSPRKVSRRPRASMSG